MFDIQLSEEVLDHLLLVLGTGLGPDFLRGGSKLLEISLQILIELEDGSNVAAAVAVVGCGPDGNERVIEHRLIAVHHKLVCSADQVYFVLTVEFLDNVATEQVAGTSGADGPANRVIGVRPHQITHSAVVRHFLFPVDGTDLVKRVNRRAEATVHAENFVVYDSGKGKVVKNIRAIAPDVDATKLAKAFIIEAVDLSNLARLVVAADERDTFRVADFQCN